MLQGLGLAGFRSWLSRLSLCVKALACPSPSFLWNAVHPSPPAGFALKAWVQAEPSGDKTEKAGQGFSLSDGTVDPGAQSSWAPAKAIWPPCFLLLPFLTEVGHGGITLNADWDMTIMRERP